MALYKVSLKLEYTVDMFIEGEDGADDAKRRAAMDADSAVGEVFHGAARTVGTTTPLSAVCLNSLE